MNEDNRVGTLNIIQKVNCPKIDRERKVFIHYVEIKGKASKLGITCDDSENCPYYKYENRNESCPAFESVVCPDFIFDSL